MKRSVFEIEEWIRQKRFRFPGNGLWLIGHEPNTEAPENYKSASLRMLIFRLSPYAYVASSLSHGILAQLSLNVEGVYVDYGFMPPSMEAEAH